MKKLTHQIVVLLCSISVLSCNYAKKGKEELPASNRQPSQITLAGVEMIIESQPGVLINESAFYTCKSGGNMISAYSKSSKSDRPLKNIRITVNIDQVSRSDIEKFYNFAYK